eukprot:scaffold2150_cov137-Isochrysis_galbana.AAC.8
MGSATWSQIPSHAGWGEGGGNNGRGEEESIRWGATLQSGGIVCLIVVKCRIQIQQLGVESLWRGYERPAVQKPSQIAADVGGAHTITVEQVAELPSLRAACRVEALPQSPDLRHPPPRGAWASGLDLVAPTAPALALPSIVDKPWAFGLIKGYKEASTPHNSRPSTATSKST